MHASPGQIQEMKPPSTVANTDTDEHELAHMYYHVRDLAAKANCLIDKPASHRGSPQGSFTSAFNI